MKKQNASTEICFIAPSVMLGEKAKKIINDLGENIDVYTGALDEAYDIAKKLVNVGASVVISRKGTKTYLEKMLSIPVIDINTILSDYIDIMKEAININGTVAFFAYQSITEDVKTMCKMLGIDARYYMFSDESDCEKCVKDAIKDGAKLGIGGALTEKYAFKYNLPHIVVENSEESIVNSITTAKQILAITKEEFKKQEKLKLELETYQTVLDFTHDAIIAIDDKCRINVINPVAQRIMNVKPSECIGKHVDNFLLNSRLPYVLKMGQRQTDELMEINGVMISTNRVPIIVDNKIKGVVATFQDIKTIQNSEKKIRIRLNKKGHIAKYNFSDIIGSSEVITKTIELAKKYAFSDSTILIHGETGSGKELFAQSIHNYSARKNEPFVAVNCAALTKNLLEAELFGYEEGAFTGASKGGKAGLFELAHRGTIFLDEIGEIPIDVQIQLLRVLQEREVRRIGSDSVVPIDVRVITATNRSLEEEIKNRLFRQDLYYRLNVLNLEIPPLRARKGDVEEIGLSILKKICGDENINIDQSFIKILNSLSQYDWPGNVRELHNFIERVYAFIKSGSDLSGINDLTQDFNIKPGVDNKVLTRQSAGEHLDDDLKLWEKNKIISCLKNNNLVISSAAKELNISRSTLWRKIKEYNIKI